MKKLAVLLCVLGSVWLQAQERPNIILIMTDQHQAQALSVAGNMDLSTPNLDKLANAGVRFENTYVTFPLCTPSRSSIFTGKMPHELDVKSNKAGEQIIKPVEKQKLLSKVLKQNGYDCAYGGKWHAHESDMVPGNDFEMIAPMGDIGLAEKSIDYLKSKVNSEKPFFLTISYDNPHNICEWARNQPLPYGNVAPTSVENTPELPVNHVQGPTFPEVLKVEQNANKRVYPTANYTEDDWRQYRYAYYQLVEKVDAEIGRILNAIEDLKLDENTVIIFTSDHGDGNASHGWNQKTALFQEAVNVPFFVSYKGTIKPAVTDHLVSNGMDLYPTILDFAEVEIPTELRGESLKPYLLSGEFNSQRENVFIQTRFRGPYAFGTMGRAVVSKKYKYVLYDWGKNKEQLFDLENDPYEMNNLINSPAHLEVLNSKREALRQFCETTNDEDFLRRVVLPSNSNLSSSDLFKGRPY